MKPIGYRIMKTHDFKDSIYYRAACDCASPECDLTIELEIDGGVLWMHFYKDLYACDYFGGRNWLQRLVARIGWCLRLLFFGRIKVNEDFLFIDKNHIEAFIDAIRCGLDELEKRKNE